MNRLTSFTSYRSIQSSIFRQTMNAFSELRSHGPPSTSVQEVERGLYWPFCDNNLGQKEPTSSFVLSNKPSVDKFYRRRNIRRYLNSSQKTERSTITRINHSVVHLQLPSFDLHWSCTLDRSGNNRQSQLPWVSWQVHSQHS